MVYHVLGSICMNCYNKIFEVYDSMPKQQKRIADYIVTNINDVVFFSISDLAQALEVSEATIVRFAQNLSYKGFPELKKDLIHYYQNFLTPSERLKNTIQILAGGDFSCEKVMRNEVKYLEDTIDSLNPEVYDELTTKICESRKVFVFGMSLSNAPLVVYLGYRLNRFGIDIVEVPYSGVNMMEFVPAVTKEDVVIIYQFLKASPDYYSLTKALSCRKAMLFLITDNKLMDLMKMVDRTIIINRGPLGSYHTITVPLALTSAIVIGVAEKMGQPAVAYTEHIGKLRRGYYKSMYEAYPPYIDNEERQE